MRSFPVMYAAYSNTLTGACNSRRLGTQCTTGARLQHHQRTTPEVCSLHNRGLSLFTNPGSPIANPCRGHRWLANLDQVTDHKSHGSEIEFRYAKLQATANSPMASSVGFVFRQTLLHEFANTSLLSRMVVPGKLIGTDCLWKRLSVRARSSGDRAAAF